MAVRKTPRALGLSCFITALVGVTLASVGTAAAVTLGCGSVVTTSVTLATDIGPCPGEGLTVSGPGVTVDLNHHTVRGDGNPESTPDQVGIRVQAAPGVQVINGTVRDFNGGIVLGNSPNTSISGMTVTNNIGSADSVHQGGIDVLISDDSKISRSVISGNGTQYGINVFSSKRVSISDSQIIDNNVITPAFEGNPASQFDVGIAFDGNTSDTLIQRNQILRNGFEGVSAGPSTQGARKVLNNIVADNGVNGINTGGFGGDLVDGNLVTRNGFDLFRVAPDVPSDFGFSAGIVTCGACFEPGPASTYQHNQVSGNKGTGIAILFNYFQCCGGPPRAGVRTHVVQYNAVYNNGGDGIYIECDQTFAPWPFVPGVSTTSCMNAPPHPVPRIVFNSTGGNGGAGAGTTAWDLHDGNANCAGDVWAYNTYQTANPPCTHP